VQRGFDEEEVEDMEMQNHVAIDERSRPALSLHAVNSN
jgi:hypothetical protein